MNRKILIIFSIVVFLFGSFIGLVFHELGHMLMAFIVKAPVKEFHIGIISYVKVDIFETTNFQNAMISIGSFIIPELIYLVLLMFSNAYIVIFRILSGVSLYMNILLSIVILIIGSNQPETWDILMFQEFSKINSFVIIIFLTLILSTNIFLEIKNSGLKKLLNSIV